MQDAINLVWAYTLNDLDYMSLPGRVVTNGEIPTEPILNAEGVKIGERPMELDALVHDRIAWLQGQGISIDEWKPADISGFSKIIEQAIQHIAAQTRDRQTGRHTGHRGALIGIRREPRTAQVLNQIRFVDGQRLRVRGELRRHLA